MPDFAFFGKTQKNKLEEGRSRPVLQKKNKRKKRVS